MAVQKNTNDLLSQAATNLPNNTTQQISPQDIREMAENLAVSSFNKITDSALVGLKSYNTLVTYESGQACINGSDIYIANQITGPGAFNAAHWDLFKSGSGTQNKLAKFGANGAVTNSSITDNGTNYLFSLLNTNGFVKTNGGTGQLSVSSQVSATEGGTGKSSWVAGSIPYISATNTFGEVTAAGNDGKFLSLVAGVPTWATVSAPNLGTANLTSTDDSRTFTLKSGGTASQNFQILNSGGGNLLKLSGNKAIDFGSGTNTINPKFYLDGDVYQYFSLYNKTNANSICDIFATPYYANGVFYLKNAAGNPKISMNAGEGGVYTETAIITLAGPYSSYRVSNSIGNNIVELKSGNTDNGEFYLRNSSGTYKVQIAVGGSIIDTNLKVGGSFASATAALQIVGPGSTSGTTTALFQNSASVAALTIKDDLTCTFGGDVIFSQSTNSTATGANARITSHPTSTIVLTNASLTSIGSIVAGLAGGHIVTLMNETGASITIVDAYGSAAAGEVIYTNTASNLTIRNNCGATFQYNATGACWTKI